MIRFLFSGLIRDRSRSLFPVIIVATGVAITVIYQSFLSGALGSMLEANARFDTGHLKVMTKIYSEKNALRPNDLSLTETGKWIKTLNNDFPDTVWLQRIKFGALLDLPDENGETLRQAPVIGFALDITSRESVESKNLEIDKNIVRGSYPQKKGEILISEKLFDDLGIKLGQKVTLISSGMDSGMAVGNFSVAGTVKFGIAAMDRGTVIVNLKDAQKMLAMDDAASEIIGLFKKELFEEKRAKEIVRIFNARYLEPGNKFSPVMTAPLTEGDMGDYLNMAESVLLIFTVVFVFIITLVFWNAGVRNGIRRYSEFGLRLAIGENKLHLFISLIIESLFVGVAGSFIGTIVGLAPSFYLMRFGFDISRFFGSNESLMIPNIIKANITHVTFWIGFIPGIFATELGTAMAGSAVFRRQTAQLFKELEI
ncbi:MAG: hypothetical protein HQK54_04950 [Oligoflexales bacterium]|nr:hypothetical protein [Oligoflexales bacterium]